MRRSLFALMSFLALASCQTQEEQAMQDDAMCQSMAHGNQQIWAQCMMNKEQIRELRSIRRSIALQNLSTNILAQQNQPVYRPVTTTDCTRYGRNVTCTSY